MKITNVKVLKIPAGSRQKTAHCYFFLTGESILENLQNRRNRPNKEFRKLLPEVFKKTQFENLWNEGHIKANWFSAICPEAEEDIDRYNNLIDLITEKLAE